MFRKVLTLFTSLALISCFTFFLPITHAAGVVATCDEPSLDAALVGGGSVTFSCSGTITLTTIKTITANTILDGNGQNVTLSGAGVVQMFVVNVGITLEIENLTLSNGTAFRGGAIENHGVLNVTNARFSNNNVSDGGGAIANMSIMTVTNSTFFGNTSANDGGGIVNFGGATATISNSAFFGNTGNYGGALSNFAGGTMNLTNNTLSSNTGSNYGGGIDNNGTLNITSTTFYSNAGVHGPNMWSSVPLTATVSSSIFYGSNCNGGAIADGGNNIAFNVTGCPGINADPLLLPLANNGGSTQTHAFNVGSAAFDAYSTGCPATDQRGTPRPQGAACDIGAYEATTNGNGVILVPTLPPPPSCVDMNDTSFTIAAGLYCNVLMRNGGWIMNVGVPHDVGSVPDSVIQLGVIFAVDVIYYDYAGHAMNTFPDGNYQRVCLQGEGRFLYDDGRNLENTWAELTPESDNGYTCAWIAAPGIVALVQN